MATDQPVHLSCSLSKAAVDHQDGTRLIVMLRLSADRDDTFQRAPLNLSFVLDRSGSMQGDKIQQCKHAVKYAVSQLMDQDTCSIVLFQTDVSVLIPHDRVMAKDRLLQALEKITADGSTNLSGGWKTGSDLVLGAVAAGVVSRVVLLTDGQANVGIVNISQLCAVAETARGKGALTTTIGFGAGFNENLLQGMAQAGGGNFHYIETAEEAPTIFAREFDELLRVLAQNLRIEVRTFGAASYLGNLNNFTQQESDGAYTIALSDLCAGDQRSVLLEFVVPARKSATKIAEVKVSYQQVAGEVALREFTSTITLPPKGTRDLSVDPKITREVLLNETVREMQKAQAEADANNLDAARERLDKAREVLETSDHKEDPTFKEQIYQLNRIKGQMVNKTAYASAGRKSLSSSSIVLTSQKTYSQGGALEPDTRHRLQSARKVVFLLPSDMGVPLGGLASGPKMQPTANHVRRIEKPQSPREAARLWRWIRQQRQALAHSEVTKVLTAFTHRWPSTTAIAHSFGALEILLHPMPVREVTGSLFAGWNGPDDHPELPDIVWNGNEIPADVRLEASQDVQQADVVLVVGSLSREFMWLIGPLMQGRLANDGNTLVLAMHQFVKGAMPGGLWTDARLDMSELDGLRAIAAETSTYLS
ncbi:MAG TPA: VWA domain-containing protein [Candidatus Xenobia bacterium]|jgi:Ca-activated chloride channel family protein